MTNFVPEADNQRPKTPPKKRNPKKPPKKPTSRSNPPAKSQKTSNSSRSNFNSNMLQRPSVLKFETATQSLPLVVGKKYLKIENIDLEELSVGFNP